MQIQTASGEWLDLTSANLEVLHEDHFADIEGIPERVGTSSHFKITNLSDELAAAFIDAAIKEKDLLARSGESQYTLQITAINQDSSQGMLVEGSVNP